MLELRQTGLNITMVVKLEPRKPGLNITMAVKLETGLNVPMTFLREVRDTRVSALLQSTSKLMLIRGK